MKKRIFSWLLLFSMVFTLLPQTSLNVFAAEDESSYKQLTVSDQNSTTPINVTENTVLALNGTNTLTSTSSPIQVADGVTLSIVLGEGSDTTITCTATEADVDSIQGKTAGIYVPKTATLNIRNANDLNPGKLTVTGGYGGAGIGGGSAASAYEDKDPGRAGDGDPGLAVQNYAVTTNVISASRGWGYINGVRERVQYEDPIYTVDSRALAYAQSLAPTRMKDTPGGTGGANGKNATDNTQDCGTVNIKSGTIYAYGGQGGAGIGGGVGANGANGGDGNPGSITDEGKAYGKADLVYPSSAYRYQQLDGVRAIVKTSVAGSSGGGAGGNGGNGGRGSNGGNVTIDGGNIFAVGGKSGTATAAGIGGGVGGTGGNGGNGADGGDADANGLAGRGGDGQAGNGGNGGNSGDAGILTINGGNVIAKGNNGFGVGNYGTAGSNGTSRGRASSAGTAGFQGWKTEWENVMESYYSLEPCEATKVFTYEGVGGAGGEGGKSTPVTSAPSGPGAAGTNTISNGESNIVFINNEGQVSSNNLPTNGTETLYEYNLTVKDMSGLLVEGAIVNVKDANGRVVAQSIARTEEEADQVAAIADGADVSRYGKGVATLWLPAGTYTLTGNNVKKGDLNLGTTKTKITVSANQDGVGGSETVYLVNEYSFVLNTHDVINDENGNKWTIFPDAELIDMSLDNGVTNTVAAPANSGMSISTSATVLSADQLTAQGDDKAYVINSGYYRLTGNGSVPIKVADGETAVILLENVTIESETSPIQLGAGSKLTLVLKDGSENTFTSIATGVSDANAGKTAGINVPKTAELIINKESGSAGTGKITVNGGYGGAGIGGNAGYGFSSERGLSGGNGADGSGGKQTRYQLPNNDPSVYLIQDANGGTGGVGGEGGFFGKDAENAGKISLYAGVIIAAGGTGAADIGGGKGATGGTGSNGTDGNPGDKATYAVFYYSQYHNVYPTLLGSGGGGAGGGAGGNGGNGGAGGNGGEVNVYTDSLTATRIGGGDGGDSGAGGTGGNGGTGGGSNSYTTPNTGYVGTSNVGGNGGRGSDGLNGEPGKGGAGSTLNVSNTITQTYANASGNEGKEAEKEYVSAAAADNSMIAKNGSGTVTQGYRYWAYYNPGGEGGAGGKCNSPINLELSVNNATNQSMNIPTMNFQKSEENGKVIINAHMSYVADILQQVKFPFTADAELNVDIVFNESSAKMTQQKTLNELEAYYTYPVIATDGTEKKTYAEKTEAIENGGGYKAVLTTAFKDAVSANKEYAYTAYDSSTATETNKIWAVGSAIPNPIPENSSNGTGDSYTYDMGKQMVRSLAGMYSDMPNVSKLNLSDYTVAETTDITGMFSGTGTETTDKMPVVGVVVDDNAASKFNDPGKSGIDITKLYFGNVAKIDYGANALNSDGTSQYKYAYGRNGANDEAVTNLAVANTNSRFVKMGAGEYLKGFQTPLGASFYGLDYKNNKEATLSIGNTDLTEAEQDAKDTNALRYTLTAKLYDKNSGDVSNILVQPVKKSGKDYLRFITLVKGNVTGTIEERNKKIETISEVGFVIAADGTGTNPTIQAGYQYNGGNSIFEKLRAKTPGGEWTVIWDMDMLNATAAFAGGVGFRYTDVAFKADREYAVTPYVVTTSGEKEYGITRTVQFTQADFDQMMQSSKPTGN